MAEDRAEAMPIGTMIVDFFGRENNIDITTLGLSTTYEREWPGHSFQFNFDAATTDTFWARSRGPVARPLRFGAMARFEDPHSRRRR